MLKRSHSMQPDMPVYLGNDDHTFMTMSLQMHNSLVFCHFVIS